MFTLRIEPDNDAFSDDPSLELARILQDVARKVADGQTTGTIRDSNGNRVGEWHY